MMLVGLAAVYSVLQGGKSLPAFWLALAGCLVARGAASIAADRQKHCAGFDLVFQIRRRIILRLKSFSLGFYTEERLGEIGEIVHKDVDAMEMVVGHLWTRMLADFIVSATLLAGELPLSTYLVFVVVSREFYKPFKAMESHWASYLEARESFSRIKKVTQAPAVAEPRRPVKPASCSIAFDRVGFSYERGGFSLTDVSFTVPERTLTALVGE